MFIQAIVLAVIIGFLMKGNLKNLANIEIKGLYIVIIAFLLEAFDIISIRKGMLHVGTFTLIMDIIMYSLLLLFVVKNIKNPYIVMIGIGFALNAAAIFANGGAMPVSLSAVRAVGLSDNVASMGLYTLIGGNTKLWFLGDIIPYTLFNINIISIGDIISAAGVMLLIIANMRKSA